MLRHAALAQGLVRYNLELMVPVLEAVPNFSEGRDLTLVRRLVDAVSSHEVEVLDWSADPDHNRSVITYIGAPDQVESAALSAASLAFRHIDMRAHRGVHPRVGALDVLPFVPLHDMGMEDAVASAHRVGAAIADLGVPVFFYAQAADPPGRGLASIRRGGFEALVDGWPSDRRPDLPSGVTAAHPTAGVVCIGARKVLLAWNVVVAGIDIVHARRIASMIRERDGGFPGLRALGLRLPRSEKMQISMNLEDPERTSPLAVFDRIESEVRQLGGEVLETEVIGMMPDALVLPDSADRLRLPDLGPARVLSHRVAEYVSSHAGGRTEISDVTE